jgi:hypothetical protein
MNHPTQFIIYWSLSFGRSEAAHLAARDSVLGEKEKFVTSPLIGEPLPLLLYLCRQHETALASLRMLPLSLRPKRPYKALSDPPSQTSVAGKKTYRACCCRPIIAAGQG